MKLGKLIGCLVGGLVLGITGFVIAGSGSIAILDGGSVSRTYAVTTDGSGFFMGRNTLWDSVAGANGAAVTAANALKVDNSAVTQPVNESQINGVAVLMGNGVSGTGAQRVTIASDSTGQITLATGANVIGALTANQSTNEAQINGVAVTMGNGVSGTGVQRVTLASDSTGQVTLATGANTIGALTANQSVNIAQMNGVATTMGNGVSGTGVQRVTLASDGTGKLSIWDTTNTATVKAASTEAALTDTGMVVTLSPNASVVCPSIIAINQTTSTDVKTLTNVGRICSVILVSATAQSVSLIQGTGTVCATGTVALIGGTSASVALAANGGFSAVSERPWLQMTASAAHICVLQSGAGNVSGVITYQDHA